MKEYVVMKVHRSRGYSGKISEQGWVSEPLRAGEGYRVFVQPDHMDWGDSELYRKNKGRWHAVYHLPPDEMFDADYGAGESRVSIVTWISSDGDVKFTRIDDARRREMLRLIDAEYLSVRDARLRTRKTE